MLSVRTTAVSSIRHSRYDPSFMEASVDRDQLKEGLQEGDERLYKPIKAATPEQTTSLNYDPLLAKFIRQITKKGNKQAAQRAMNNTFEAMKFVQLEKYHKANSNAERNQIELNTRKIFHDAVENCKPLIMTRKVSRGGMGYTIPWAVTPWYATYYSIKWLVEAAEEKDANTRIWNTLSHEFINASQNEGRAIRKKQELHRVAEENRAYAHYRWAKQRKSR